MPAARLASLAASARLARGGEAERHRADDGIAGAGDVRDLARLGRERGVPVRRVQPHAVLAARHQHAAAAGTFTEPLCRLARLVVRADTHVRDGLGFVMVGRDDGGAGVIVDVRHFRIDQHGNAGACAAGDRCRRHAA